MSNKTIKCIICNHDAREIININEIYIGFCKDHNIHDYEKQHSLMRCIVCDKKSTKLRRIGGVYLSFCKTHNIKDYNVKKFWS